MTRRRTASTLEVVVPDVYATITEADPAVVEQLADMLDRPEARVGGLIAVSCVPS